MNEVFAGLKPAALWNYFSEICAIPHESKNEAALIARISEIAHEKGVEVKTDSAGNLCVCVPATPGKENTPTVVLQGHLDMVCEKNSDVEFDFAKDPIRPIRDGEWIRADRTTLGADNGIGVAAGLAFLDDNSCVHGPLELLMTLDEETGLTGAMKLDASLLEGRILLNLDSEEDGLVYVGCAGGAHLESNLALSWKDAPAGFEPFEIKVFGAMGGHSGCDIHLNRANSVKLVTRAIERLHRKLGTDQVAISKIDCGNKHNAIPREGSAFMMIAPGSVTKAREIIESLEKEFQAEFAGDADLKMEMNTTEASPKVFSDESAKKAISMLLGFHNGVVAMSRDIDGLVETSNSLAIVKTFEDRLFVLNSSRSSQAQALEMILDQNRSIADLAGANGKPADGYPGWQPNMKSPILGLTQTVFEETFGKKPAIAAIHAGLECGLIGEKFKNMDMVSFGPEIRNPHSPDEMVHIGSVENFWKLLCGVLEAVANGRLGN